MRRLEKTGLYDRALVVVTADHGIGFEPGGSPRFVTEAAELSPTSPGNSKSSSIRASARGLVDRRDAETIDIVPTIADAIGARIPWHVDGRSLRGKPVARRVSVHTNRRGSVSASANAVAAGVLSTARRNAALFGEGTDSLYCLGPHKELLGRQVEVVASTMNGVEVRLDDAAQFEDVRTASLFSPSHIAGEIQRGSLAPGTPIAIAVNGRVAATTRTYGSNETHFSALVPEGVLLDGNSVRVYTLRHVAGVNQSARLAGARDAVRSPVEQQGRGSMSSEPATAIRATEMHLPSYGVAVCAPRRAVGHSGSASRCSRC